MEIEHVIKMYGDIMDIVARALERTADEMEKDKIANKVITGPEALRAFANGLREGNEQISPVIVEQVLAELNAPEQQERGEDANHG